MKFQKNENIYPLKYMTLIFMNTKYIPTKMKLNDCSNSSQIVIFGKIRTKTFMNICKRYFQ